MLRRKGWSVRLMRMEQATKKRELLYFICTANDDDEDDDADVKTW